METTIAVKERTVQILLQLKGKLKARSMDETIMKLLQKSAKIDKSRFGSTPKLKAFSEEDKATTHEL